MAQLHFLMYVVLALLFNAALCRGELKVRFRRREDLDMDATHGDKFVPSESEELCCLYCAMSAKCVSFIFSTTKKSCKLNIYVPGRSDLSWYYFNTAKLKQRQYWERVDLPPNVKISAHGFKPRFIGIPNSDELNILTGYPFPYSGVISRWTYHQEDASATGWIEIFRPRDEEQYELIYQAEIPPAAKASGYHSIRPKPAWSVDADDVIAIRPRIGSKKLISTVGVSVAAGLDALEEKFRPFAVKTMICGSQPKKNVGAIQNITVCQANYTLSAIRCNMK